jgi:hypothetical protein
MSQFTFAGGSAAGAAALAEPLGQGDAVPDDGAGSDDGTVDDGAVDDGAVDDGAVPDDVAGSDDGAGADDGTVPDDEAVPADVAGSDDAAGSEDEAVPDDEAGSEADVTAGASDETAATGLADAAMQSPAADWAIWVAL